MRSALILPALGATAVATALVGTLAVPMLQPDVVTRITAQSAVDPQPLREADEQAQIAERKAHARSTAAAAAAAQQAAAQKAAAEKAAAERAAAARASRARRAASADPRSIAQQMLAAQGQAGQFGCLEKLWMKESGWRVNATNPSSGAYGIPQSLPAGKMASAGSDWRTNPATQIRWGIGYITDRYGSPCAAWAHSQSVNWY